MEKPVIPSARIYKFILYINIVLLTVYFSWWFLPGHVGNPILYSLLVFGEAYHVFMALTFWFTIWPRRRDFSPPESRKRYLPAVDVFIPVTGEPVEVVEKTVKAAKELDYPNHTIFILNDGFVAGKENWKDIETLARKLNVQCITRKTSGGAKAGNINNALRKTTGALIAIFDADMVTHRDFLKKTLPHFRNSRMGFVQTPQYYHNTKGNAVAETAWKQQELFFGPIMQGKEKSGAVFICGTNVLIRRTALEEAGGMYEKSIAEDFLTSIIIHEKKWESRYVPEVLAEGMAPEDLMSYYKQQSRWARGSLQVLLSENPLLKRGLSTGQKIEYLASALYYFNGVVVLIDILMPLLFLIFGWQAVNARTTTVAFFFLPFMFFNLLTLYVVSDGTLNFNTFAFVHSSFFLHVTAFASAVLGLKSGFSVTPKEKQSGNYIRLVYPHLLYILLVGFASALAIYRWGLNPSVATNIAWAVINALLFIPFIKEAYPWNRISVFAAYPVKARSVK